VDNSLNEVKGERVDWINQWVHFKIRDVYHPDPMKVLADLHGNDLLMGKVIDLSDSGMQKRAFAVIAVEGIQDLLVVPIEQLLGAQ
jgi:hypothetical protein